MPSTRKFVPVDLSLHFPILSQQKKTAYCIVTYEYDLHRFIAVGFEDGYLLLLMDSKLSEDSEFDPATQRHQLFSLFFTPITSIQFSHFTRPLTTTTTTTTSSSSLSGNGSNYLRVLVTSSMEPALVLHFEDIKKSLNHFTSHVLPYSDQFDSILCSLPLPPFHTSFFSTSSLLEPNEKKEQRMQWMLGTYQCYLILYEWVPESQSYLLSSLTKLPYPIYSLNASDLNADGLPELMVTTTHGLHIYQYRINRKS